MMNSKPLVEIKEITNLYGKPYLFLLKQEKSKIYITSSYDKEFYKELMQTKEDYDNGLIEPSKETKKLLNQDISYLLANYRFDEDKFKEGKDLYRYEHFMQIEQEAKCISENSLYDWSIIKNYDYLQNIGDVYKLNDEGKKVFYSILQSSKDEKKIIINDDLKREYYIYYVVNSYITLLYLQRNKKTVIYTIVKRKKHINYEENKNEIRIRKEEFQDKIRKISRHLLLPYNELMRLIEENKKTDNFYDLLDYIEINIYGRYPRAELKEHLSDCIFINEYEQKQKEGVKTYEKNIFQRFRKLF